MISENSGIRIDLRRDFGRFQLAVDLELPGRGVSILFGPSGCGKTSLLRGIAGLDHQMRGYLSVNGEVWLDSKKGGLVPPHRRSVGYVFQDAALFPHLRVKENLAYGKERAEVGRKGPEWDHVIDLLNLGGLLERYPDRLSGGEMQRVAIARALLSCPNVLLMDEPLASLDAGIKHEILSYLDRLHQESEIPVIYVTHAANEVLRLADFVAILDDGGLSAVGPLEEMLPILALRPDFGEGSGTVVRAHVVAHHSLDGVSELNFNGGRLWVPLLPLSEGSHVRCRIFPGDVSLSVNAPVLSSVLNVLPVTVSALSEMEGGSNVLVHLNLEGSLLLASVTRKSSRALDLHPGQSLYAQIKATTLSK